MDCREVVVGDEENKQNDETNVMDGHVYGRVRLAFF